MILRDGVDADLPAVMPFFRAIVAASETYAYLEDLSDRKIGDLWLVPPPSRFVVAVDEDDKMVGSAMM